MSFTFTSVHRLSTGPLLHQVMDGKDQIEIFSLFCVLVHKKDPTIFTRSKNAFQFSSDLSCTCALFESTDKSNDERIVKAEARKTKMKQRKRTSGGSDNDGTAKNKLYEAERERERERK